MGNCKSYQAHTQQPEHPGTTKVMIFAKQTPSQFIEKDAVEKFIEGLLPSQLASHLDRKPPRSLSELNAEVDKYAKSDADHKRRVE